MNTLLYDFNNCYIRKGDQTLQAGIKPEFSFDYLALSYDGIAGSFRINNEDVTLTDSQIQEIEDFIVTVVPDPVSQTNLESRVYLADTDWYVIRKSETGVAIPQDILDARAASRLSIVGEVL
jgi:hypothetical protein